ncbi:MAG: hypothetical protein D4S01_09425, partial [Dehalococcoidia bacterium]
VALPIKIEYNKQRLLAETKNISVLGTCLETDKEIPIGAALDIEIEIPKLSLRETGEKRWISCKGAAFRCQPIVSEKSKGRYGIGIFFRSFAGGEEKAIAKYIEYFLQQESEKGKIYMRKRKHESK